MRKTVLVLVVFCIVGISGCCGTQQNTITQISTINAILAGAYDGQMTCGKAMSYGDFGIGTFDRLDGEMILLDDKLYQVRYDGVVYSPPESLTTPFAAVVSFSSDVEMSIKEGTNFDGLKEAIDKAVPNMNIFCAVKLKGHFLSVKARSVPPQNKPYPPLVEVTKKQTVFLFEEVSGTIVGFRSPSFVKGINVPGYHLHFISNDTRCGGHVLEFVMQEGTAQIDICNRLLLILPEDGSDFAQMDLGLDRSRELEKSER